MNSSSAIRCSLPAAAARLHWTFPPNRASPTLTLTDATISNANGTIRSAYNLDVVLKGKNTIALDAGNIAAFYPGKNLTLKGDGDLTILLQNHLIGFHVGNGSLTIAMDGDLTIRGGGYGIKTGSSISVTGKGDLSITGCDTAVSIEDANRVFNLSGSGNVALAGKDRGITLSVDNQLVFAGSGEVNISGGQCGISFVSSKYGDTNTIRLDGKQSPITVSTTDGTRAISIEHISGMNRDHYQVIGAPGKKQVIYTYYQEPPKTGDNASPLLWTLLAAMSCTAVILLGKRKTHP